MRIETFYPKGLHEDDDLEKKMVRKDVLSPADITAYADEIVYDLDHLRSGSKKEAFVLDALSDDRMKHLANLEGLDGLTREEIAGAMDRVRKALIEALRGKIDDSLFFVVKDLQVKSRGGDGKKPDIISEVTAGGGKTSVHKRQPPFEGFEGLSEDALAELAKLPPHENIAALYEHDPSSDESLWEKRDVTPLSRYMLNEKDPLEKKFQTGLTVVRDCMKGALFLAEHGLVLQDIHPLNLGLEMTDKGPKGVLFDFGGLGMEGDMPAGNRRMSRKGYFPPVGNSGYHPSEMTYQFGKTLEALAGTYIAELGADEDVKDVKKLAEEMSKLDPKERPSLEEATERLEAITHWIDL